MPGPVLLLALPAAVGDGFTSATLGELVLLPLPGLITLVTPVPVRQGLWHVKRMQNYLQRENICTFHLTLTKAVWLIPN